MDAVTPSARMPNLFTRGAILIVQAFRVLRTALYPVRTCRFYPTCTDYAVEALIRHGILRGGMMAMRRVLRCHPFHPGGHDPVPLVR